jgi:hypothetical protein
MTREGLHRTWSEKWDRFVVRNGYTYIHENFPGLGGREGRVAPKASFYEIELWSEREGIYILEVPTEREAWSVIFAWVYQRITPQEFIWGLK